MRIYKTLPDLKQRKQMKLWHKAIKITWSPADIDWFAPGALEKDSHRRSLARALSPILMGEQAALYSITQIIQILGRTSEVEGQFFLTSMLMDESKHVELFTRYYGRIDSEPLSIRRFPPGYLFQSAIMCDDPMQWLTGSLISEVLAKRSLEQIRDAHVDPVLDDACTRVLEDESRHLGFNHIFLADRFQGAFAENEASAGEMSETLLERLEYVLERVPPILQALEADTDEFGMESPDDFFEQLREECRTRLMKSIETGQREWQNASLTEAVSEEG